MQTILLMQTILRYPEEGTLNRSRLIPALAFLAAAILALSGAGGGVAAAVDPVPPNVIVILSDDQSDSSVAKMPYMSTRAGWYRFTNAYINNATCCPSRATLLTGRWSHHTGVEATGGAPRFDD